MSVISGNSFVYKRSKPRTRRTDGEDDLHPAIAGLPRLRFTLGVLGRDEDFQGLVNLRHWAFGWNVQLISTVKNWFSNWLRFALLRVFSYASVQSQSQHSKTAPFSMWPCMWLVRFAACVVHGRRSRESMHYATISNGIFSGQWIFVKNF